MESLREYFQAEHWSPYEPAQRRRMLAIVLWVTLAASLLIAWINFFSLGDRPAAVVIFCLSLLCILGMRLNRQGHYLPASILASGMAFLVVDFNLIEGYGLQDPVVVAFPIMVIFGSLLFGRRASAPFAAAGILSVAFTTWLGLHRDLPRHPLTRLDDAVTMAIFIVISAVMVWAVMDTLEKNLGRLRKSEFDLRNAYDATLEGWAKALEYRDNETEGHSRRVVRVCLRLAYELGCSEESMLQIYRGALLHDIGKMAIPDAILFKPGPLDETEWKVMKQHPVFARNMLADIPFLQPAGDIPYCHHERWDGRGYPQGLCGEAIPLPARIFTIVDHWDALRTDRPYRKAWPEGQVLDYIRENAGVIFDPQVTAKFLALYREGAFGLN